MSPTELPIPRSLAPVLGARSDGTAGVDTSRGLLTTILGELVLPSGGQAWTQTLVEVMAQLGVNDKAARQSIARLRDRGWLDRTKVGRRTRWSLTDHARELLVAGAERIYSFGQQQRPWDGSWLVLLASVPERDRSSRYRMGLGLGWAGFGSLGQGVWLSPWVEQEAIAAQLMGDLGVDATSFRAELGALGSGPELAAQAWDLPELRCLYERFLADTDSLPPSHPPGEEAVGDLVALVHRWRRFPFLDPDLPGSLLAPDWPGPAAAHRFGETRRALLEPAMAYWAEVEAGLTGA